jgi:hypothetical protein
VVANFDGVNSDDWKTRDEKAQSVIILNLNDVVLHQGHKFKSTKEVWNMLVKMYKHKNPTRMCYLESLERSCKDV